MERLGDENLLPSWKTPHLAPEALGPITRPGLRTRVTLRSGHRWPACTWACWEPGAAAEGGTALHAHRQLLDALGRP